MDISKKITENLEIIKEELGVGISFDTIVREFTIGRKKAALIFIDGLVKDDVFTDIFRMLMRAEQEEIGVNPIQKLLDEKIPYVETDTVETLEDVLDNVLAGAPALLLDGQSQAIVIDARTYPARGPEEPDIERVTRGSRDGFVETIVFNTALIRRRIRDSKLRIEMVQVGRRSKTDVAIVYLDDVTNAELVETIKGRVEKIEVDAMPMAEKTIEEFITRKKWNFLPKVRYSERPDVVAAHIFEGHVAIVVDTSPSVILAPVTLFHHLQHAEEYRQDPVVGTYLRWIRLFGIAFSLFVPALWLALALDKQYLPEFLSFIGTKESGDVPLFAQFIIASIGIDLVRMACIHVPSSLATSLGFIGSFMLGDFAVQVGVFSPEVVLYMAAAVVGAFATPSLELALAANMLRLFLIVLAGIWHLTGFLVGLVLILLLTGTTKSFGVPYLWPLVPFEGKSLLEVLVRKPGYRIHARPTFLKTKDSDQASGGN